MTYARVIGTARITTGPDLISRPCSRCGLVRAMSGKPAGMCRACSVLDDPPRTDADDDWRARGTCAGSDNPELWFPVGQSGPARAQEAEAKAECQRCDVRETCLKWALDTGESAGAWGGMSESERALTKRRQRRAERLAEAKKPKPVKPGNVTSRAADVLTRGETYTGAEMSAALGGSGGMGSGGMIGALLSAGIIEPAGRKRAFQGRTRLVPAYRLVTT